MNDAVIVTGASSGIGSACALHLHEMGYHVFAGVRKPADGAALRDNTGDRLVPIILDVTDTASIKAARQAVEAAFSHHPEVRLRGLVNNAGMSITGPGEFVPLDDLRRQFEVNTTGQIAVTQAFLPLIRHGQGRIIMIGSVSGRVVLPFGGPYSASKAALEALTAALRMELQPWHIPVTLVEPGAITTPMWGKSRARETEMIEQLPQQTLDYYGDMLVKKHRYSDRTQQQGIPALLVARVVAKALQAPRPRTRYLIGRDAWATEAIRLLPDRLRDTVLLRYIGL